MTSTTQQVVDAVQAGAMATSQAISAASETIEQVVGVLNNIPSMIRNNAIFSTKVVGANLQALTDVVSGAAKPKKPPVTKDNMAIITFMSSKYPAVYAKLLEHADKMKDLPSEKRTYEVVNFSHDNLRTLLAP